MKFPNKISLLLIFILLILNCLTIKSAIASAKAGTTVDPNDSLALVAFYNATNGPNWTYSTNWLKAPVNTWHGIKVENNRVTEINLYSNLLIGKLPEEIGQLNALTSLSLNSNQLSGSIPADLGQLSQLKTLRLEGYRFTGSIPPELSQLLNLEILYLYSNQLNGSIPSELGNLENLKSLYLLNNQLTGNIPSELGRLSKLNHLYLMNNELSGDIPDELGQLENLAYLNLQNNNLSGSIPNTLGKLSKLNSLYLGLNKLSGNIPVEIGNMGNLVYLQLNNNNLSGEIPKELGQLSKLRQCHLYRNQLSGNIPAEMGQLLALEDMDFSINQLTGVIPAEIGQLTKLSNLNLSVNRLNGTIPATIGNLTNLKNLSFERNELTGDIPSAFNLLTSIEIISLGSNKLTGFLADYLQFLPNLAGLNVFYNNLTFEDLEDKNELFDKYFYYSPQNKIGRSMIISLDSGVNYTLDIGCGGTQNLYQWHFNGQAFGPPLESSAYKLTNIQKDDLGDYYCLITNVLVPGLVISSETLTLTFKASGVNAPTNILLTKQNIDENTPVGAEIGTLSTEDEDWDDFHTYKLVSGEGDEDNGSFFLAGNQLHSNEVFDFETRDALSIRVETTDNAGQTFSKWFTIAINDVYEPKPPVILLSNNSIDENLPIGTTIGLFSDESEIDLSPYTYSLIQGEGDTDNANFYITGNQLFSAAVFDYEQQIQHSILVQIANKKRPLSSQVFEILINDIEENDGGSGDDSTAVELMIPNAFSPNNDGINDFFEIPGLEKFPENHIDIYNRFGNLVYKMDNYNAENWWNGTANVIGTMGKEVLPEGTYFMVLKLNDNRIEKQAVLLKK